MNRPRSVSTPALAALAVLGFGLVYGLPMLGLHFAVEHGLYAAALVPVLSRLRIDPLGVEHVTDALAYGYVSDEPGVYVAVADLDGAPATDFWVPLSECTVITEPIDNLRMDKQRQISAIHEAGHAVAVLMRGDSELRSVTLSTELHGEGLTQHASKPDDVGFIAYAGAWAEARAKWEDRTLDAEYDDSLTFNDYVVGVLLSQPSDRDAYLRAEKDHWDLFSSAGIDLANQPHLTLSAAWDRELARVWPVIRKVAQLLADGENVTHAVVESVLYAD